MDFFRERGRSSSSSSFTIVQNHFTSLAVKGFEQFYRGSLKSLFACASARSSSCLVV